MKKIYSIVISSLLCASYAFGMEITPIIVRSTISFPEEIEKRILFYAAENAYKCSDQQTYYEQRMRNLKNLIYSISYVDKKYYEHINSPITTHTIINNFTCHSNNRDSRWEIANTLATPGAKNYISCSEKLYSLPITLEEIEELVRNGADVNYGSVQYCDKFKKGPLLIYLLKSKHLDKISKLKTVLDLGADIDATCPNFDNTALHYALINDFSTDIIKLLLSYKPKNKCLHYIINGHVNDHTQEIIDLFLASGVDPDEFLSLCTQKNDYPRETHTLLKYFLDKGANPSPSLLNIYQKAIKGITDTNFVSRYANLNLELFCNYGAYNKQALEQAYAAKEKLDIMIELLEKNKPYK